MERTPEPLMRRATDAAMLGRRVDANQAAQSLDLPAWIREGLPDLGGARVLELCAGTGMQTRLLLDAVGEAGSVRAVDISREALEALRKRVGDRDNLTVVAGDMEDSQVLGDGPFDLAFCAYGLYYARDPQTLLDRLRSRLSADGRIVVVGPWGPNNAALFDLLEAQGVALPEFVTWSSRDFMPSLVLPWAAGNFADVHVRTTRNDVAWTSAEQVLEYWRNSTFHDADREDAVAAALGDHFGRHDRFVNRKHIMMVEMHRAH